MGKDDDFIKKLVNLSDFLERQANLDESLHDLAAMAANILNAENCSIMFLKSSEDDNKLKLRVSAHVGNLPEEALHEAMEFNEGISGHVAATQKSLLVEDIEHSNFRSKARRHYSNKSFLAAPILINKKLIGVININTHKRKRTFNRDDMNLLNIIALLISKSIQLIHLQKLIQSQYTMFAIAQEKQEELSNIIASAGQDLDRVAKLLAKTFYREMSKAGFGTDHIINAASEIISLLNDSVTRHKKRLERS